MNSPERVLVDTSAWIVGFRGSGDQNAGEFLKQKIAAGQVVTSRIIILELIQGCKREKDRDRLRFELESLEVLGIDVHVWDRSYGLAFDLRRKGITVPTVDIIVAALALENRCLLLHFDRHFPMMARHVRSLNLMAMGPL
ncbi:MAG TPA: PIN domain nuclease [Candidatus Latescibacteria bacterium]|nr:PIN domain nuclease [Candidatus Latescibacterota bacterium]